jgi:hypothetical protein
MKAEEARRLALAQPEATEQDHHGRPSFRVAGKIFATLWADPAVVAELPADAWDGKAPVRLSSPWPKTRRA